MRAVVFYIDSGGGSALASDLIWREVERVSSTADPASLSLEPGFNTYVRRAILPDHTETGIIQCRDGTFGKSGGIQGSCSGHGGNVRALYAH